jgi:hypothetical protein
MATTKGGEINMNEIHGFDTWIETLMTCKPLAENDVKALCDKVRNKL